MERAVTNLANHVAAQGHEVSILNLFKTEVFFDLHPDIRLIWPEINRQQMHRLIYAARLIPYVRNSIRDIQPDTVLSFGEWFNAYVILVTRGLSIPVFVTDRMGPDMNLGLLLSTARKWTYPLASGIIAQTQVAAQRITAKTGAMKIKVIPNGVPVFKIPELPKKNQVVTVGRLSREKGHIHLLRAFARLNHPDWTLHIVGDGPERVKLEQECHLLGIANTVRFYGHQKGFLHILHILSESEIFVLPSMYEGFPNALLEAMSVPLACISSDCIAGPAEIIQSGVNGLLVIPGDVDALTLGLKKLIENPALRKEFAKKAALVKDTYALDKLAEEHLRFITGSIAQH
jgi:glycosyltransferase involved in cell wall biosynthesis